jgi:hypothetical protein
MTQNEKFRKTPRFRGGFFTWSSTIFTDQENGVKAVFLVYSSGKREVVKKFLFKKLVWDQLSKIEFELFLTLLKDSDYLYWSFLKLLVFVPKKILRKNLVKNETILGLPVTSRESYLGSLRINIEIQKVIRNLPKPPKFSGYIKSLAARGKSRPGELGIEPNSSEPSEYQENIDMFQYWEALLSDRR